MINIKKHLGRIIIISFMIIGATWSFSYLLDGNNQFELAKETIESTKYICGEGFNGTEYGYTGEIYYARGLVFGSPFGFIGSDSFTDEQKQFVSDMIKSKLQSLPCFDEYVILGELKD